MTEILATLRAEEMRLSMELIDTLAYQLMAIWKLYSLYSSEPAQVIVELVKPAAEPPHPANTEDAPSRAVYTVRAAAVPLEENSSLSGYKNNDFGDRQAAAAAARRATLERFRAQPGPDDPVVAERRAAQVAVGLAREARLAERRAERAAEEKRRAAEAAARIAEQAARAAEAVARAADEAARKSAADAEVKARSLSLAAEQKAVRDARYAARKARQRR